MNESNAFIGCAGWALSSPVVGHFPIEGTHLERYAQVFSTVEINSSFYREHQIKTYKRWAMSVPETFRFSVKMPRTVTHERRLHDVDDLTGHFFDQVDALEEKLGCILVQLPPSLRLNLSEASHFFERLRQQTAVSIVCEPRHASWFTVEGMKMFATHNIAFVHAHPEPVSGIHLKNDSDIIYMRLHGAPQIYFSSYDTNFLTTIAGLIQAAQIAGKAVWCVFDNTARGHAIPNALSLLKLLTMRHS